MIPTLLKAQVSEEASLATKMTLRDCTLFIQIPKELIPDPSVIPNYDPSQASIPISTDVNRFRLPSVVNGIRAFPFGCPRRKEPSRRVRILISDLDEKSEKGRGEYWASQEESLIKGGYYVGMGKLNPSAENCDLSDVVWNSEDVDVETWAKPSQG